MSQHFVSKISFPESSLWQKLKNPGSLTDFELELTGRCNNNCRHCYINLPEQDKKAKKRELSLPEIKDIAGQAFSLGATWCLLTGGEPLLREDFFDIYLLLKKKGFLVSVFTNATLITKEHVTFFKKYPPRDLEITVYGIRQSTYERISRKPGSFDAFMRGLNLLLKNGLKVRLKAMALRSNVGELNSIASFCRVRTKDYFRFDPFLHLRFDRDQKRNEEIKSERLSFEEIVGIEGADSERFQALKKNCDKLIRPEFTHINCNHLFYCGAGNNSFTVSYDGFFRLCSSLWHPQCIYDLKKGSIKDAWKNFIPKVRNMRSNREEFLNRCHSCSIINLCLWCPAHAYLETGEFDKPVDYFCDVAGARRELLLTNSKK